jgi:hypothetical protein
MGCRRDRHHRTGVATIRRGAPLDLRAADFRPYEHLRERASSEGVMNSRPAAALASRHVH